MTFYVVALLAVIVLSLLVLTLFRSPPIGKELARHDYRGETYALVEYGDDIAIFTSSGSPVNNQELAASVLSSYAWKLEFTHFDTDELAATARWVAAINDKASGVRDFTNDVVAIFDNIDSVGVDIPLIGRVSAMDALSETLQGVDEVESAIRALDSELNDLDSNAGTLTSASDRMLRLDPWNISGEEMDELFVEASDAAYDLANSARSVKKHTDILLVLLEDFIDSDSALYEFSIQLSGFEYELSNLGGRLRSAHESATQARKDYMDRWLKEPHDAEWPPSDPERRAVGWTALRQAPSIYTVQPESARNGNSVETQGWEFTRLAFPVNPPAQTCRLAL